MASRSQHVDGERTQSVFCGKQTVNNPRTRDWKPGDLYESCGGHPVLCTDAGEGDPHGGLFGISLVDGTFGHGCNKAACAPRRLTLKEALTLRQKIQTARNALPCICPPNGISMECRRCSLAARHVVESRSE